MTWQTVAIWLVFAMLPFAIMFPVVYGLGWPWYRTSEGRAIFTFSAFFGLLVAFGTAYQLFPHLPGRAVVATFVYGGILLGLIGWNVQLVREWLRQRRASQP